MGSLIKEWCHVRCLQVWPTTLRCPCQVLCKWTKWEEANKCARIMSIQENFKSKHPKIMLVDLNVPSLLNQRLRSRKMVKRNHQLLKGQRKSSIVDFSSFSIISTAPSWRSWLKIKMSLKMPLLQMTTTKMLRKTRTKIMLTSRKRRTRSQRPKKMRRKKETMPTR